jgi:hypothetical protein
MNALELTKIKVQENKDKIIRELKDVGFIRVNVVYKNFNRKEVIKEFYMMDEILLMNHLKPNIKTLTSFLIAD